jgi:hypothetical protein
MQGHLETATFLEQRGSAAPSSSTAPPRGLTPAELYPSALADRARAVPSPSAPGLYNPAIPIHAERPTVVQSLSAPGLYNPAIPIHAASTPSPYSIEPGLPQESVLGREGPSMHAQQLYASAHAEQQRLSKTEAEKAAEVRFLESGDIGQLANRRDRLNRNSEDIRAIGVIY